jgi:hypothetical protein
MSLPTLRSLDARLILSSIAAWAFVPLFEIASLRMVWRALYADEARALQLRQFAASRPLTASGASDYHGLGTLGASRTCVFARDDSERAIPSALREGRTVVYGRDGHAYDDPDLIQLAAQDQRLALPAAGAPQ